MFKLVIQDDEGKTTIVPLIRDEITIGRKEGNTIRLTERNVSRRHARILRNNGEVHIEDLGSYNGIRVNNARIAERVSLRVSDQVQIGDYKLYLKAEGAEQADDARTMPIERVEQAQAPQQSVSEAHTAPIVNGTGPSPIHTAPTAPQIIGNPNRTLVALTDADPTLRAVGPATAAAVAALNATAGYGKLVVLSSNFAGKELELSRPQMIIGRTDENDLVINHRSISRNHAKITREPETSRYTISDLQSSNGVRVNGQDYGKVELRRGDVIDLGHVRLRFVDVGEDFVFARDAVITDVPEASGRRSTIVALLAAIVVVVAGMVVYAMRSSGGGDKPEPGSDKPNVVVPSGPNGSVPADAAEAVAAVARPETPPDAAAPAGQLSPEATEARKRCLEYQEKREFANVVGCVDDLRKAGANDLADEFYERGQREIANKAAGAAIEKLVRDGQLRQAQAKLDAFDKASVYAHDLVESFRAAERQRVDKERREHVDISARAHDCAAVRAYVNVTIKSQVTDWVMAELLKVPCTPKVAAVDPTKPSGKGPPPVVGEGSGATAGSGAKPACTDVEVDGWISQAGNQGSQGYASVALTLMQRVLSCRPNDARSLGLAAIYACAAKKPELARGYVLKLPSERRPPVLTRCFNEGITDLLPPE